MPLMRYKSAKARKTLHFRTGTIQKNLVCLRNPEFTEELGFRIHDVDILDVPSKVVETLKFSVQAFLMSLCGKGVLSMQWSPLWQRLI